VLVWLVIYSWAALLGCHSDELVATELKVFTHGFGDFVFGEFSARAPSELALRKKATGCIARDRELVGVTVLEKKIPRARHGGTPRLRF
jgi:hypothetical protein